MGIRQSLRDLPSTTCQPSAEALGTQEQTWTSPVGTNEGGRAGIRQSLRDLPSTTCQPGAEALGYSQSTSLRSRKRFHPQS